MIDNIQLLNDILEDMERKPTRMEAQQLRNICEDGGWLERDIYQRRVYVAIVQDDNWHKIARIYAPADDPSLAYNSISIDLYNNNIIGG